MKFVIRTEGMLADLAARLRGRCCVNTISFVTMKDNTLTKQGMPHHSEHSLCCFPLAKLPLHTLSDPSTPKMPASPVHSCVDRHSNCRGFNRKKEVDFRTRWTYASGCTITGSMNAYL